MKSFKSPSLDHLKSPSLDHLKSSSLDHLKSPSLDHLKSPNLDHLKSPNLDHLKSPNMDNLKSPNMDYYTHRHSSTYRPTIAGGFLGVLSVLLGSMNFARLQREIKGVKRMRNRTDFRTK